MKTENTATRLQKLMDERHLRQIDILDAARPFCEKFGVKLNKSDLSQYLSGKVEPGQDKLFILGCALNVSEVWLMGYDVSPERNQPVILEDNYSQIFRERLSFELAVARDAMAGDEPGMADIYELEKLVDEARPIMLDEACRAADMVGTTVGYLLGEEDVDASAPEDNKKSPGSDESEPRDDLEKEFMSLVKQLHPSQKMFLLSLLKTIIEQDSQASGASTPAKPETAQ